MLGYQKTMFDRYYCIKTLENASKSSYLYYYDGAQKHEGFMGFEKRLFQSNYLRHSSVTKLRSFLYTLLLMKSIFVTVNNAYM